MRNRDKILGLIAGVLLSFFIYKIVTDNGKSKKQGESATNTNENPLPIMSIKNNIQTVKNDVICPLQNNDNMCYFNSMIQCLYTQKEFVNFFLTHSSATNSYFSKIKDLFIRMNNNDTIYTSEFVKNLPVEMSRKYKVGIEHDSREFFMDILDLLISESSGAIQKFIIDYFTFQLKEERRCSVCLNEPTIIVTEEKSFLIIPSVSVLEGFWNKLDSYPNDCGECKNKECLNARVEFGDMFPKALFVQIPGNNNVIIVDEVLEIKGRRYVLNSFCIYSGSISSGHYYSYCKRGDKWYLFNFSSASEVVLDFSKNFVGVSYLFYELE